MSASSGPRSPGLQTGQAAFGRRQAVQQQAGMRPKPAQPFETPSWDFADKRTAQFAAELAEEKVWGEADDEARAHTQWKTGRKRVLPWRQMSLMAGLSFGVGGFVLPDSVNDWASWLMYGLMGMAFYVGLRAKREKKAKR